MSFIESPVFPERVSIDASTLVKFSNVRTVVASGFDDVLIRHEQPLRTLVFIHPALDFARHRELNHWFNATKGMGHRFRAKDYGDFRATITEGVLAPLHSTVIVGTSGVGYGVPVLLLQKKYTAGGLTTLRNIQKPRSIPPVAIYRGGVLQTLTTHYTIDYTTGKVTFVADQTRAISAHVVGGDHKFTLASALSPNVAVDQRVWVTGVSGTAAATLNNLSHIVSVVSSADVTIQTSTSGLTASGGTLSMYPQESESLAWAGDFDVPVRFDSDVATFRVVGRGAGVIYWEWSGINLLEVRLAL